MNAPSQIIPSDDLAPVRELIAGIPSLAQIFDIFPQLRFVVDSNVIIGDLIWLAKTRENPSARTSLQEVIDAGAVIAFAPARLCEEVEKHIPKLARKNGIPEEMLREEWLNYQTYLRFCDVEEVVAEYGQQVIDPNDLPFVSLYGQVGAAAVISKDPHISAMGAPTVKLDVIIQLRDYSRSKSVEVTIKMGGYILTGITIEMVFETLKLAASLFKKLPSWMQVGLIVAAGILLLYPKSRGQINAYLTTVSKKFHIAFAEVKPVLAELIRTLNTESNKASKSLAGINRALPPLRRVPLRTVAYSVCLAAGTRLTLSEIQRKVLINGYKTKSKRFASYLRRVMIADTRFVLCKDRRWTVIQRKNMLQKRGFKGVGQNSWEFWARL